MTTSIFWKPRDQRYGETASSPGSIPRLLCPPKPPNAPPPSISNVLPLGDTTNSASPCPTSKTLNSSFPADHAAENGNNAMSKEHANTPPLSPDATGRRHVCAI